LSDIRIIRYSGFFDEPGAFGLYSFFAILLNKIYFKNKKVELWLIFLTLFTLSLAFYALVVLYFLFFYINKSNLKYILLLSMGIGLLFVYLSANTDDNEAASKIYDLTFKRFEMDDSGLAENNRASLSEHDKEIFFEYPILGSTKESVNGSNLFSVFAKYGIFGALFYYAFLVYFIFQIVLLSPKDFFFYFKLLLLILVNFYSRPEMSSVFSLLVFVSIIYYIRKNYNTQHIQINSKI
jgi:hypothetical protein